MKIVLKRSEVTGKIPSVDDLSLGELAINTTDGTLYTKKSVNGVESVIQVGAAAGSGSSTPGTGSGNLDSSSPAMNSITPTGYGQSVSLPDATTMSNAATNVFTIINESQTFSLGLRDFAGVLRRVIPPQAQCNIGLKNKTSVNDGWTYSMTSGEGGALPIGETFLPSTIYPAGIFQNLDPTTQVRFGNALISIGTSTANFSGTVVYLLVGNLTTGAVEAPVQVYPSNDTNLQGAAIYKLSETSGIVIGRSAGNVRMVNFVVNGTTVDVGPLYSTTWAEANGGIIDIGQFVPNSSNTFLLTYSPQGNSNYITYARYFTVAGNALAATSAVIVTQSASLYNHASYRNTELVSGTTFFNYGMTDNNQYSGFSISISPGSAPAQGQQTFTTAGTATFTVPAGVTTISAVCVGGGGGGGAGQTSNGTGSSSSSGTGAGGGALRWIRDLPVTPGETLTVVIGAAGVRKTDTGDYVASAGNPSAIRRGTNVLVQANGGDTTPAGATGTAVGPGPFGGVIGGGNGGKYGQNSINISSGGGGIGGGGGGAGGYSGNGGAGGNGNVQSAAGAGTGGGGGGGSYSMGTTTSGGGGGVGLLGEGSSGSGAAVYSTTGGGAGSGGAAGSATTGSNGGNAGAYGGGGGGANSSSGDGGDGGKGAVRIIWGNGRAYPSTVVADQVTTVAGGNLQVGTQVSIPFAAAQTSTNTSVVKPNRPVRLPGTDKWVQFFVDGVTANLAAQCWMFNGTTLSLGTKFVSSSMGVSSPSNLYLTPAAYSSNVALHCLTVGGPTSASYSILSAVAVQNDGTPSLISTQIVDYVSTFTLSDIISYGTTSPNVVTRWKFNGAMFEIQSTTYFGLGDYSASINTTNGYTTAVSFVLPQNRAGQSFVTPVLTNGVVNVLQGTRIKSTPLLKTMTLPLTASSADPKAGGFGIARNFVGSETLKRVTFSTLEVVQPNSPPATTAGTVNKPTIVSPAWPSIQPDTFIIGTNGFDVTGGNDVHLSTDYQVWSWNGENQLGTKVWESLNNSTNKTSIRLPVGVLTPNTPYTIRARHTGASLGTSDWGVGSIITATAFAPTVPGTPYGGGFYAGRYQIGNDLYAIVVAPRSVETWSTWGTAGPNSLFDGKSNTTNSNGPVATTTKALTTGGFNDWYIGSAYENDLIYSVFKPSAENQMTGFSPLSGTYGLNPYSVPTGAVRTPQSPAQTADPAWRVGATGTAQTLPSDFGSSTAYDASTTYSMQPTSLNGITPGAIQSKGINQASTYRPIRRVKLN